VTHYFLEGLGWIFGEAFFLFLAGRLHLLTTSTILDGLTTISATNPKK
jgi:hypothetical protein